jgi:hypothetical protein
MHFLLILTHVPIVNRDGEQGNCQQSQFFGCGICEGQGSQLEYQYPCGSLKESRGLYTIYDLYCLGNGSFILLEASHNYNHKYQHFVMVSYLFEN